MTLNLVKKMAETVEEELMRLNDFDEWDIVEIVLPQES